MGPPFYAPRPPKLKVEGRDAIGLLWSLMTHAYRCTLAYCFLLLMVEAAFHGGMRMSTTGNALQMGEVDLAWRLYKGLKTSGMEPADYPPVNMWMAKRAIAGLSKPSVRHDLVSQDTLPKTLSDTLPKTLSDTALKSSYMRACVLSLPLLCHAVG